MKPIVALTGFFVSTLLSVPVQACQLICLVTSTTYTGNLGGLSGADAKCAAEFPNFKFARSSTLGENLPMALMINSGNQKTLGSYSVTYRTPIRPGDGPHNCNGWTTTAGGALDLPNAAGDVEATALPCTTPVHLVCCNM